MHYNLTEEIISLSVSDYWAIAKAEWEFSHAYQSEGVQTCLCGHYPIRNICVIFNKENSNETEVGNCCINKFLGIEKGNKIFESIKRLKDDISKSMSAKVLDYLHEKKVVSSFEYNFYTDILRKRNLSFEQLEIKERINQKLLDFTSYEANSVFSKINMVLKWAESRQCFDTSFIQALKKSAERSGKLSEKQSQSLENIISKWKITQTKPSE